MNIIRVVALAVVAHACFGAQTIMAGEPDRLSIKPVGVGLEYLTQEQDFSVTDFTVDNPVLNALLPANAAEQVAVASEIASTGVRADYWVKPYLNVFGTVARMDTKAVVDLSALGLPSMNVDADGNLYNAGATLAVGKLPYFGTLTYIHSVADLEGITALPLS